MKTLHTFKIIDENETPFNKNIFPTTDMSIPEEASLSEMIEAFEKFLLATGYVLPENSTLGFVEH